MATASLPRCSSSSASRSPGPTWVLLGAGGAARGAAVECLRARCATLWIGNRTAASLAILLAELEPLAGGTALQGLRPCEAHPPACRPERW
ncbi:MAG: hypothetical protein WDM96_14235 [Lacunisphaera sp.]